MNKLEKELAAVSKKLENENFLNKAPHDVVEQVKAKHSHLQEKQQKLESNLERIREFETS
jgi:valyl-tRNA synthetase